MTKKIRRNFTPQEKVSILKQHLLEGKSVSDVCDAHGLNPTQFYRWQKEFFENGAAAFEKQDKRTAQAQQRRYAELEAKLKKKDTVIAEIMEDLIAEKKTWGALKGVWVQPDLRDRIVDFVRERAAQTELPAARLVAWIGISASKFYDWRRRYGKVNEHNAWIPRDHWLEDWEKRAIVDFYQAHPDDGYRRVTYLMMDSDVVAASPSSVYRVLSQAGVLRRWETKPSKKGKGFAQPLAPHAHWHIDVSYLNLSGTFYYLCSLLDGYSRYIVHHEIREQMTEQDVEIIVQRALEAFPDAKPRIISDNGPQFVAKDFKSFIRIKGMDHVRTSPYYPQSNGKLERWHKSLKSECIRPKTPLNIDEARRLVSAYVDDYNQRRLHSAIGYVTPADKLAGKAPAILANRDRKLAKARERRAENRRLQSRQQPMASCEIVS